MRSSEELRHADGVYRAGTLCDSEALLGSCEYALCLGMKRHDIDPFACVRGSFGALGVVGVVTESVMGLQWLGGGADNGG